MRRPLSIRLLWAFALMFSVSIAFPVDRSGAAGAECLGMSYREKIPCYKQMFEHIVRT
jgi:hypothetical protein